jgi:hypothetical protein
MTSSAWKTTARVALFGMIVNSIFAVAKILGGVLGHAYVLIADGIESGLDIAGSFVIWSGLKVAARPPDASHPYGHGKAEPIAAVIVGAGVLAAAVGRKHSCANGRLASSQRRAHVRRCIHWDFSSFDRWQGLAKCRRLGCHFRLRGHRGEWR